MNLFFLLFIITILFFIPIPIIIKIYFSLDDYYIKIYKFTIITKRKLSNRKVKKKASNKTPSKNNNNLFSRKKIKKIDYKNLIIKLYNSKFKPIIKIDMNLEYSLADAAKTAIFYGVLSNLNYILNIILNIPFITKHFKLKIIPTFKDNYLLKFETKSIIFLSIANIIYMMVLILKYMLSNKEVAPDK